MTQRKIGPKISNLSSDRPSRTLTQCKISSKMSNTAGDRASSNKAMTQLKISPKMSSDLASPVNPCNMLPQRPTKLELQSASFYSTSEPYQCM